MGVILTWFSGSAECTVIGVLNGSELTVKVECPKDIRREIYVVF